MKNQNKDPQREPERTKAQSFDRLCNRMLLALGAGVGLLAVFEYLIKPLMS